jgi:hypothetical protein
MDVIQGIAAVDGYIRSISKLCLGNRATKCKVKISGQIILLPT